tara:strand:- start:270 stop:518 length:249 start_codon:yes stop_codon:yes gene_type:complete
MTITTEKGARACLSNDELPIGYQFESDPNTGHKPGRLWAFFTHPEYDDVQRGMSPFVHNPILLKYDNKLTKEGEEFSESSAS